jgi:DNA-binding PadR family transcriptional regulator
MEQREWLDATWGYTEKNRKAKFYRLTPAGRRQLAAAVSHWSRYSEVVGMVLAARGT